MLEQVVLLVLRHSSGVLGGWLVSQGIANASDAQIAVGVIASALAYGWSYLNKVRDAKKANTPAPQ
jgi:hypothetical protein